MDEETTAARDSVPVPSVIKRIRRKCVSATAAREKEVRVPTVEYDRMNALSMLLLEIHGSGEEPWLRAMQMLCRQIGASGISLALPETLQRGACVVRYGASIPSWAERLVSEAGKDGSPRDSIVPIRDCRSLDRRLEVMGADIEIQARPPARLRVCKHIAAGSFSRGEQDYLQAVIPHLRNALRNRRDRLADALLDETASATVERLRVGIVLLNEQGRVLRMNRAARDIFACSAELCLANGAITSRLASENRKLWAALRRVIPNDDGKRHDQIRCVCVGESARVGVQIKALRMPGSVPVVPGAPCALMYLRHLGGATNFSIRRLRELFGLTRTEARLALEIADGACLDEAAAQLGIRRNTARTHLRSIFQKMNIKRQSSLVQVLWSSAAILYDANDVTA